MPTAFEITQLEVTGTEISQLLEVCKDSRPLRFDDGEYLFREGEESAEIYLILRGAFVVEQRSSKKGQQTIASHCNEVDDPCFVGEMACLGGGYRTASVRSSGATFALELKPEHLEVIIERLPTFTRILCQQFTARLKEANNILKKITDTSALQVTQIDAEAGDVVIHQGAVADKLYQLIYGELEWECNGQPIKGATVLDFIEPAAYFFGSTYPVTVRAKSPACLVAIDKASKEAVVRNYPQLILRLYTEIGRDAS